MVDLETPLNSAVGSQQELIVKLREDIAAPASFGLATDVLEELPFNVERIFPSQIIDVARERSKHKDVAFRDSPPSAAPESSAGPSDSYLTSFARLTGKEDELLATLGRLIEDPRVEYAYIKPPTYPAAITPPSPDFSANQRYLDPAPDGIDAKYAWTFAGGRGECINFIDIEGDWRLSHEDLIGCARMGTGAYRDLGWRNHGTAVLGVVAANQANGIGMQGIAPSVTTRCMSIFDVKSSSATAIAQAAASLSPGDILLIELHRPGPRFSGASKPDQRGYIAIEWWEDDRVAVEFATSLGIIVVAAAGNGAEDLDDALYNTPQPGFPPNWSNPFARGAADTQSVLVGAGAPPSGAYGADRSRLGFSNYGSAVDAQGWGREVATCGYGDLHTGAGEDQWYTGSFSGTSSASPIVVGALACLQGILHANGLALLTPSEARDLLRKTGSLQQSGPNGSGRIGSRPDLVQLIDEVKSLRGVSDLKMAIV